MNIVKKHSPSSIFFLILFLTTTLGILSRITFLIITHNKINFIEFILSFSKGFLFDLTLAIYLFIPFALLGLLPERLWQKQNFQRIILLLFYLESAVISIVSFSEVFFMQEFNSRFNFIAVDYLVYSNEVIKNIWESYPLAWILPAFLSIHFFIIRFLFTKFFPKKYYPYPSIQSLVAIGAFIFCILFLNESKILEKTGPAEAEVSKNPIHALFAAYRNNEINYKRFYTTMNENNAGLIIHEKLEDNTFGEKDIENSLEIESSIERNIVKQGDEKKLNIVIVLMESMSARFMQAFGGQLKLTPNLDTLAKSGLFFDHVYSTGTRTVRGIEAVVLSLPPTPGQSIVRRPNSNALFNIGSVLREKGYSTQFVYGGNSFFDNMGNFFASNGFQVLDKSDIPKSEIHFSNAWGVCDEDLFDLALKESDKITEKPFFQLILTTSNHRPYTYPEGRIDIPSRTGRDGAVKYSDYAIGQYIEKAKQKPWFHNTIFIFVADHNASVAGGTSIFPYDYRIPIIFYSPEHIQPRRVSHLGSQIDLAPTLFGILNLSYNSKFFGHDLLHSKNERAFLATYQTIGLWQNKKMVLLSPNHKIGVYGVENEIATLHKEFTQKTNIGITDSDINDAIAYYETASDWYSENKLKESWKGKPNTNLRNF